MSRNFRSKFPCSHFLQKSSPKIQQTNCPNFSFCTWGVGFELTNYLCSVQKILNLKILSDNFYIEFFDVSLAA